MSNKYDVIVYDGNGPAGAFSYARNKMRPTGGTEVHLVQLCEGIAGYAMHTAGISSIENAEVPDIGGFPRYFPVGHVDAPTETRALVTCGLKGLPPEGLTTDKHVILWTHDPAHNIPHIQHMRGYNFVCVSHWQANRFPKGWRRAVIPPMIDHWVYQLPKVEKDPNKYVCVSAYWKGTLETMTLWPQVAPPGATLYVGSPYSHPPHFKELVERTPRCKFISLENPGAIVHSMRDAAGTFRVCTQPETFGVTDAIAQVLGCRTHVFCTSDVGGLAESLEPTGCVTTDFQQFTRRLHETHGKPFVGSHKDFRPRKILPQWMDLLDL